MSFVMLFRDAVTHQWFILYENTETISFRITCGAETTFNEESDVELFSDLSLDAFSRLDDSLGFLKVGLVTTFVDHNHTLVHYHLCDAAYTDYAKEVQACNSLWGMKEKINQ